MVRDDILPSILRRMTSLLALPRLERVPLLAGDAVAGWIDAARAERLLRFGGVFERTSCGLAFGRGLDDEPARTRALDDVTRQLAAEGVLSRWRDERFSVAPDLHAPPWFLIERAAARYFGVETRAVHVNGLVATDAGARMWIARRSSTKAIDPGQLDNLVGGGIGAGHSAQETAIKEAWEEAGIAEPLAIAAKPVGIVRVCRDQPDGLHRETIFAHDLWLPAQFAPAMVDGEVVGHRLATLPEAATLLANASGDDVVTADASLVILDCLLRHGAIPADASGYAALCALRSPAGSCASGATPCIGRDPGR